MIVIDTVDTAYVVLGSRRGGLYCCSTPAWELIYRHEYEGVDDPDGVERVPDDDPYGLCPRVPRLPCPLPEVLTYDLFEAIKVPLEYYRVGETQRRYGFNAPTGTFYVQLRPAPEGRALWPRLRKP